MTLRALSSDHSWSLFLDRDGVINKRIVDGYVLNPDEFVFLPGVTKALKTLSGRFGRIFIVTNQQGIGKGLMSSGGLENVHKFMLREIEKHGGRIDSVYYSPNLEHENHHSRKPNPGMALQAKADYPDVDFLRSVMVGDMEKDIEFGKKLGMTTVFIGHIKHFDKFEPDFIYDSLLSFAKSLLP